MFKTVILAIIANIVVNNCVLENFLGFSHAASGKCLKCRVRNALVTAVIVFVTALAAFPIQNLLYVSGFEYLTVLVLTALALLLAWIAEKVTGNKGTSYPIVAVNSAVLGCALVTAGLGLSFGETAVAAFGTAAGYVLAVVLMAGVESRIDNHYVPKAFRGIPATVLAAAIISMVLVAFK